jgi:hypothetical protein
LNDTSTAVSQPRVRNRRTTASNEPGVCGVQQPVEAFAVPSNGDVERRAQCGHQSLERAKCHPAKLTRLDLRDLLSGASGDDRDV